MVEINWTNEAQLWLRDIYDYIAADNPEAAARTIAGIFMRAELLKTHSRIGHEYEFSGQRQIRILHYGHYRIAYLVKSDGNIDILGVFHGALNIERYFM